LRPLAFARTIPTAVEVLFAGAWIVVGAVYAALFVASGAPLFLALRTAVAIVVPNALLGRLSVRLAARWPDDPGPRTLARATRTALAFTALATAAWFALVTLDAWLLQGTARHPTRAITLWQTVINALMQAAILGGALAWHNGERARKAQARAQRAEALQARAELQLLRSQLNPHFVLNTLHALLGMVRRDPAAAESAIERLGELLQFGMSVEQRRSDRVSFREEWAFVSSYLELEQLRFGERLHVALTADPATLDVPIPPFALHPLVENAIAHAVAPRAAGGRLEVTARRDGGRLRIEVVDDGPGTSEAAILASPRAGLRLLRERLATLYAGEATLRFLAPPGGGLRVVLEVPDDGFPETA
jgi:signal transduction histidine kinase